MIYRDGGNLVFSAAKGKHKQHECGNKSGCRRLTASLALLNE